MNQNGFALLTVLFILFFMSTVTIHIISLYEHEKTFSELEHEIYKMDRLLFNGKQSIMRQVASEELQSTGTGHMSYYEGEVTYQYDLVMPELSVVIIATTEKGNAKRLYFIYNTESNFFEHWRESTLW